MAGFLVRRLLLAILVLFLVSVLVFAATQALGNPARAILGRNSNPASLAALTKQLHLDKPVLSQYWSWFKGILHGNFGVSLAAQQPVTKVIGARLVNSGVLVLLSAIIS